MSQSKACIKCEGTMYLSTYGWYCFDCETWEQFGRKVMTSTITIEFEFEDLRFEYIRIPINHDTSKDLLKDLLAAVTHLLDARIKEIEKITTEPKTKKARIKRGPGQALTVSGEKSYSSNTLEAARKVSKQLTLRTEYSSPEARDEYVPPEDDQ